MKIRLLNISLLLYCCTLAPGCKHTHHISVQQKVGNSYWKQDNSINYLVVGDWGRNDEFHQKEVASQMGIEATKKNIRFVMSMGDNFYTDDVISTSDPQ